MRDAFLDGTIAWRDLLVLLAWAAVGTAARPGRSRGSEHRALGPVLAWATLVANVVLVVTGGGSGSPAPGSAARPGPAARTSRSARTCALSLHEAIEFGNRTLTFLLVAVAIATYAVMLRTGRRDLRAMALIVALGIPAQATIGGITVLTDLNRFRRSAP